MANKELMEGLLIIAVPKWIEKLKSKSFEDFEKRREKILESVCYKGDLLLYGSKRKGETAELFNDLAEGLAWLALIAKGGVTFGDLHWDAEFEEMPNMQESTAGAFQSQTLSAMWGCATPPTEGIDDANTNSDGKKSGGENG